MSQINYSEALNEYRQIAKEHSLRPELLKEILNLSVKGYNKAEIAREVDKSRQTVHKYLKTVREDMSNDELQTLLLGLVVLFGGVYLIDKLFGGGD